MAGSTPAATAPPGAPASKPKITAAHFSASRERAIHPTPPEWLKLGAQMADVCNEWARRGDIIAHIGPKAGSGAPACFKPALGEMEINTELALGEGAVAGYIDDFRDRMTQFDYPVAAGALLHEAMHARHSKWSLEEVAKYSKTSKMASLEARLIELFEETRIEARGVEHYPRNRSFLRACALKLVIGDLDPAEILAAGVMGLSQLMLLTLARVDAGVLDKDDVELVQEGAEEYLKKRVVKKLRKIWKRAQAHRLDREWEQLRDLAKEWIELLKEEGHDPEKEAGEGLTVIMVGMMEEMEGMAEDAESEARAEGTVMIVMEAGEAEAAEKEAEAKETEEHGKVMAKVFDKTTGYSGSHRSGSRLTEERDPKPEERAAAITVARELEKARYRDRITTTRSSVMPPGRLRSQAAVQAAAQRSAGRLATAEPWKATRRFNVEDPKLTVGMMTDISGSMSSAMAPMAVTNWVMSEAARRVEARVASVYYGSGVFGGLRPGEHLTKVKIMTAPDSTERFDEAFQALNGALGLLNGSGARLLVIVSDFCYTPDQLEKARMWLARCKKQGVAVINLPYGNNHYSLAMAEDKTNDLRVLTGAADPASAAVMIGHEAAKALTSIGGEGR